MFRRTDVTIVKWRACKTKRWPRCRGLRFRKETGTVKSRLTRYTSHSEYYRSHAEWREMHKHDTGRHKDLVTLVVGFIEPLHQISFVF